MSVYFIPEKAKNYFKLWIWAGDTCINPGNLLIKLCGSS